MASTEINYFHVLFVAPLLGWIGWQNYQGRPLGTNFALFVILVALIVLIYHAYLISVKTNNNKSGGVENYQRTPKEKCYNTCS